MPRVTRGTSRRGVALAELIVAFVLATIVAAASATAMLGAERYLRRAGMSSDDRRALHEAGSALVADLRAVSIDSLRLRGDTAVEFLGLVGTSAACIVTDTAIVLPPDVASSGSPVSVWRAAPEAGDLVAAFDTLGAGAWRMATVLSVATRTDGAGCIPSIGLMSSADSAARRAVTTVRLDRSLPRSVPVGAPVRVMRRGRYTLFHGTDKSWELAYRRCDLAGACAAAQSVAGPLAAFADSGLVFRIAGDASAIVATLRAPIRVSGVAPETRALIITFRNRVP
jgi:hypothetical protein